jgi:hypothetical protein
MKFTNFGQQDFKLIEKLSGGSVATVYRVLVTKAGPLCGKTVALKLLNTESSVPNHVVLMVDLMVEQCGILLMHGFCEEPGFCTLVPEFIPTGGLHRQLHGDMHPVTALGSDFYRKPLDKTQGASIISVDTCSAADMPVYVGLVVDLVAHMLPRYQVNLKGMRCREIGDGEQPALLFTARVPTLVHGHLEQNSEQELFPQINLVLRRILIDEYRVQKRERELLPQINLLLKHIVQGYQDKAEAMLRATPELALYPGTVVDHAGYRYKRLTALQLAVGLLDYHMWVMVCKYMIQASIAEQLRYFSTQAGQQLISGSERRVKAILAALQAYIDACNAPGDKDDDVLDDQLVEQVGGAQARSMIHILQEYDTPTRGFDPVLQAVDVFAEPVFIRTDIFAEGRYALAELGRSVAACRGPLLPPETLLEAPVKPDLQSLSTILRCRVIQLNKLLIEYAVHKPVPAGKRSIKKQRKRGMATLVW